MASLQNQIFFILLLQFYFKDSYALNLQNDRIGDLFRL